MAKKAYPVLKRLSQAYASQKPLPSHCIVYGVYISKRNVSIVAHFPSSTNQQGEGKFCQVLLSRFFMSYFWDRNDQDTLFLTRWKLLTALLTVHRHTEILKCTMEALDGILPAEVSALRRYTHPTRQVISKSERFRTSWSVVHRTVTSPRSVRADLQHLQSVWKGQILLPSGWNVGF